MAKASKWSMRSGCARYMQLGSTHDTFEDDQLILYLYITIDIFVLAPIWCPPAALQVAHVLLSKVSWTKVSP